MEYTHIYNWLEVSFLTPWNMSNKFEVTWLLIQSAILAIYLLTKKFKLTNGHCGTKKMVQDLWIVYHRVNCNDLGSAESSHSLNLCWIMLTIMSHIRLRRDPVHNINSIIANQFLFSQHVFFFLLLIRNC